MILLTEEQHDLPIADVQLVVRCGPPSDPDGLEGLARHTFELMRRGAGGRARAELDAAFDALGAQVDAVSSYDAVGVSATCLARNLEAVVALLGDVLLRPRLDDDEHARLVREELAALDDVRDDDSSLAQRFFDRLTLLGTPYGRSMQGSDASLARLGRADAVAWLERAVVAGDVIAGFAGDVTAPRAAALAEAAFGGLPRRPAPALPGPMPPERGGRRTYLIDKPDRAQSQIIVGHEAPPARHPDFLALQLAATAFGGTFTSRLMREVRVKRGWSYGASLRAVRSRAGHSFRMRVFPAAEQTPDALRLVLDLWEEVVRDGLTDDEVAHAKAYLEGSWAFEIDTAGARLDKRIDVLVYELPADHLDTHLTRLRALDTAAVNAAMRRHWRPTEAVCVLTATAADMAERLPPDVTGAMEVLDYRSY